jgi:DNA-binding transcriptional MerR regulator
MKRRGNRRYYQHHEVLLVRRIRELLYEQGFTISGARNRLGEMQARSRAGNGAEVAAQAAGAAQGDLPVSDSSAETALDLVALRTDLEQALAVLEGQAGALTRT